MYYLMLGIIIAGLISAFVGICMVSQQRASENQKVLQLGAVCTFLAFVGYVMELTAQSLDGLIAGIKVGYMGKVFVCFLYLVFISQYGKIKINKMILRFALFANAGILMLIMTCERHSLYYANLSIKNVGGFLIVSFDKGIFYYVYMIISILLFGMIIETGYRNWKSSIGERKKCNAWLLAAALSPGVMLIVYLLGIVDNFDLTPFGLLITCLIIIFTVKRYGILNTVQIAQDAILENTKDGMIIADEEYNLVYANSAAREAFPEFFSRNGKESPKKLDEIFKNEESIEKAGDRHYEIRISRLYEERSLRGYLAWIFDMEFIDNYANEILKLKEEAERANQAKSTFLANMSHEIRTPMNAVMGLAELITQRENDEIVRKYARDIQRSSKGLLNIINDILDISKIESGKFQILPEVYYTQSLFHDTMIIVGNVIENKNLEFKTSFDENLPYKMYGDAMRLKQILLNVLNNAVKYTSKGSITFSAKLLSEADEWVTVEFRIKDTGMGIKKEDMDKLFEQFEQLDMDKNKGIEGSGLGLAIVSGFVKLMNGKIRVESEYGKGSEFIITVPQKRVGQERINKIEWNMGEILEEKERVQFCAEEAKILVVDDNELNLEITKGLLGIYGISTQVSLSGKEAIKLAEKEKYDIIFMDCMMPEMDGITAMKHIKAQMKGRDESTPIIALTANAIVGVREEMIGEGFQDYMSKPINMSDLERILLEYLPKEKVKLGQKKSISEKPVIVWEKPEEEKTKGSEDEIEKIKEYINEYQFEEAVQMLEELSQSYGNLYSREEVSWFKEQVLNYQSEELLSWLEEKKKSI